MVPLGLSSPQMPVTPLLSSSSSFRAQPSIRDYEILKPISKGMILPNVMTLRCVWIGISRHEEDHWRLLRNQSLEKG
jgi:hypothetical protein